VERLKKFWNFLKQDTWQSWIVSLLILVVLIRFVFFPLLSFTTGSPLPLVVIESCSLYHESGFDDWWSSNSEWYEDKGISKAEFEEFSFKNGLNKGDIMFVWGRSDYEIGDIIIFNSNSESTAPHPIIHRLVGNNPYETKGDHNSRQLMFGNNPQNIDETDIPTENIVGKTAIRIPFVGWLKLIFFEPFRSPQDRGLCK